MMIPEDLGIKFIEFYNEYGDDMDYPSAVIEFCNLVAHDLYERDYLYEVLMDGYEEELE